MEWLGVAGFALAVVSLVISLTLTWLKWPRIAVEVNQKGGVSFTPQTDTFFLTVINNGSEAITIRTTGFKTGKGSGTEGVDFLDAFLSPAGEALPNTLDGKPAVFPVRIEGHGLPDLRMGRQCVGDRGKWSLLPRVRRSV